MNMTYEEELKKVNRKFDRYNTLFNFALKANELVVFLVKVALLTLLTHYLVNQYFETPDALKSITEHFSLFLSVSSAFILALFLRHSAFQFDNFIDSFILMLLKPIINIIDKKRFRRNFELEAVAYKHGKYNEYRYQTTGQKAKFKQAKRRKVIR